ncbi:hypothetical protein GCM10023194_21710 [Planotetraspora phitsanulokensis]|uniref:Uncharacterized protein n=2 Tax=Planotetraspora phitsanulokensis TaxID=575192 RepID=A0A8J3U426_9ACTN|nr:hypothetical protein Pph01_32310 [Planotetraspora phitsanulokensis]
MDSIGEGPLRPGAGSGGTDAAPGPATTPDPGSPGPSGLLQVHCAMSLQQLYAWLQATVPQAPQVAGVVPLVVRAVQLYRAGQHEACVAQIQSVLDSINAGHWSAAPVTRPFA